MNATTEARSARAKMVHEGTLKLVTRTDESRLRQRLGPTAPPMAFHLWHMARWADRLQARVSSAVPRQRPGRQELWISQRLADAWKIEVPLGKFDSGMEMGDEASTALVLPTKSALVDYATRAFAAAEEAFGALRDDDLELRGTDLYDRESTVATMLVGHLTHLNRHLGMIEALVGIAGDSGTASV
jgi:hypothetical protein